MKKGKIDRLILKLLRLKEEAMEKKRYATMHAIDHALTVAGWELAYIKTGDYKCIRMIEEAKKKA